MVQLTAHYIISITSYLSYESYFILFTTLLYYYTLFHYIIYNVTLLPVFTLPLLPVSIYLSTCINLSLFLYSAYVITLIP